MTSERDMDGLVRDWLVDELDRVPEPTQALEDVARALPDVPQRRPGWRRWSRLLDGWRASPNRAPLPRPEIVLWGGPMGVAGRGASGPVGVRAMRPVSVSAALAAIALAAALMIALIYLVTGPGRALIGSGPQAPSPTPALALEPPVPEGRDIIVAADGSGHFWTLGEAVAAAVDGDRILIKPGTYPASVTIRASVSIRGEGGPEAVTLVPGEPPAADRAPDPRYNFFPMEDGPVPDWRFVLFLDDTGATVSDLTLRGAEVGTTVVIEGGAPVLTNLVIDPDGEQLSSNAENAHQGVAIGVESRATIADSLITAFVGVGEGADPILTGNTVRGTCFLIADDGTDPIVTENRFEQSQCPMLSVFVTDGAAPTISANTFVSDPGADGIRIDGVGSDAQVSGNMFTGGEYGIWVSDQAAPVLRRNYVQGARIGIAVVGADPVIDTNEVRRNGTGVLLEDMAAPQFVGNTVCDNDLNLDLRDGTAVSLRDNFVCEDGRETVAAAGAP